MPSRTTATIGSTVGALTLGTPIFDGLAANKLPFVLQGGVLVALFAILTDMLFARAERALRIPDTASGAPRREQSGIIRAPEGGLDIP